MVGTLSLVQKGQTSGHSGCGIRSGIVVYGGGDILFNAKRSNQWTSGIQWCKYCLWCKKVKPVYGCGGCSGVVVYDGGNILFGAKRSNQ